MLPDYEKLGVFYLGKSGDAPFLYDSRHLTTHGVIIGMTGSGKTGLSVALLEEAALDAVPAIVIDPKGDLSNLLLTFPALADADFAAWAPQGKSGAEEAARWRTGLAESNQDGDRIARWRAAADVAVYTPGSRIATPLSVLGSLAAPPPAQREGDALRERVSTVVTSLLGLVGVEGDPLKSREHALLSAVVGGAWARGEDLDLGALILKIQAPGFDKLGVLPLEQVFPQKERFELAVAFNHLLAAPGFEVWLEGPALDVASLLYAPSGKPKISVISIAHLGDAERMFVVTLLLGQLVAWMRAQSGTQSLRALFYMDEIFGYFPPVANPPSKLPLLTLLKQARAFGLGVLLATQNPVDLDYKGLSNCGTWFIGRLQTERDLERVRAGLEGALSGHGVPTEELGALLAGLAARRFLVHDVHAGAPRILETRCTLSYLRGPLTRDELARLAPSQATVVMPAAATRPGASNAPAVPTDIPCTYLPASNGAALAPHALGIASVRLQNAKLGLDVLRELSFAAPIVGGPAPVRWEDAQWAGVGLDALSSAAPAAVSYSDLPEVGRQPKSYAAWQKAFVAWLTQSQGVELWVDAAHDLVSTPGESKEQFLARAALSAREARDAAVAKLRERYVPKFEALKQKIATASAALEREQGQASTAKADMAWGAGGALLDALTGSRSAGRVVKGAASVAKRAAKQREHAADVERAAEKVATLQQTWRDLDAKFQAEAAELASASEGAAGEIESVVVRPKKTHIEVRWFGLAWRG